MAQGRWAEPQHYRLGWSDFRRVRIQFFVGTVDRSASSTVSHAQTGSSSGLDRDTSGADTGLSGGWSLVDPSANLWGVIAIGLVIAIASATQDITIDALRIEQIGRGEGRSMAAGAAIAVVGWWTGYKLGGVVALNTAQAFQSAGIENYWQITFLVLGTIVIACNIALMFVPEQSPEDRVADQLEQDNIIASNLALSGQKGQVVAWLVG